MSLIIVSDNKKKKKSNTLRYLFSYHHFLYLSLTSHDLWGVAGMEIETGRDTNSGGIVEVKYGHNVVDITQGSKGIFEP